LRATSTPLADRLVAASEDHGVVELIGPSALIAVDGRIAPTMTTGFLL